MKRIFQYQGISKSAVRLKTTILILALGLVQLLHAAIDPVTVIVSVTPPYTPFIGEYSSMGVNKLQVTLIVNDSRLLNYPAKLQMFIEKADGSGLLMQTSEYAAIAPIFLTGQTTEILTGADLSNYFLAQNNTFSGFSQSQFLQTGRIPDGHYRIGFRVVDAQRSNVRLSNVGYSQPAWFILNDPPYLNIPRNKEEQRVNDPQNIKLECYPRHLGSMNSAFASQYRFEIFPIRIPGMNPNQVAKSLQADYIEETNQPRIFLTQDKYMLEPGVEYAWRVKAFTDDGLTLFQNEGYSEVFSFVYGSQCPVPENVVAKVLGPDRAEISWDTDPVHTSYIARFRVKDQENAIWHTRESFIGSVTLDKLLSPGMSYDYQVKAKTPTVESDFSPLASFTTPVNRQQSFECGRQDSNKITNFNPKNSLQPGEVIYNGAFPIKLTEVSGSDGSFSGKGRMRVPFLNDVKVNMEFANISVNELNQVYKGKITSVYNPNSKFYIGDVTDYWTVGNQVGNIITGQEAAQIEVDYEISSPGDIRVSIEDNKVTVTQTGGFGTTVKHIETSTGGTSISDSKGNLYSVDEKGNVTKVGQSGGKENSENYGSTAAGYNRLDTKNSIEFSNSKDDLWAFDEWQEAYREKAIVEKEYENLSGYKVPWKLIPAGKSGKVVAKISKGGIDISKVIFKTPTGTEYSPRLNGNGAEITIIGSEHGDGQEIFALYQQDDSTTISLGKLKVASYTMLVRKLFIVPIDELNVNTEEIETGINEIFLRYGVEWDVRLTQPYLNKTWDLNADGKLDAGKSGMFSMYTPEMKALNTAYSSSHTIDEEAIYVFVLQNSTGTTGVLLGDMPISSQFGYLFSPSGKPITSKTVAHELAHGMFQLKHTFDEDYALEKSSTNNLMDYADGTILFKQQWDAMYDQQALLFAWRQGDEEGEFVAEGPISEVARFINTIRCANNRNRSTVLLHHSVNSYSVKVGELIGELNKYTPEHLKPISSKEFKNAYIKVYIKEGIISSGNDLFKGYHNINLNVNDYERKAASGLDSEKLIFSAKKNPLIFSLPIGTKPKLQNDVISWLVSECNIDGGAKPFSEISFNINEDDIKELYDLSTCQLEQIRKEDRKNIISKLLLDVDYVLIGNKDSHNQLLTSLIHSTPASQIDYIVQHLTKISGEIELFFLEVSQSTQESLIRALCEVAVKYWENTKYLGEIPSYLLGVLSIQRDLEKDYVRVGVSSIFEREPGIYRFSRAIWLSNDGGFPKNDPEPFETYEVSAFDPVECHFIGNDQNVEESIIYPALVNKLMAINKDIANMDALLEIPKLVILPEITGRLFSGTPRVGKNTSVFFNNFFKNTTLQFKNLLAKCGKLGYKVRKIGVEVALYTNLNVEIARFSNTGRLLTKVNPYNKIGTRVLSWEDEIEFVTTTNKQKAGHLELAIDANSSYFWKEIVKEESKIARSLEELAPNSKIPKNSEFNKWFNDLSEEELTNVWNNDKLRNQLEVEIRKPGELHEWCMVCEVQQFKKWGIRMEDIKKFRTRTTELVGINPYNGNPFAHSIINSEGRIVAGPSSKTFHNELQVLIGSSKSLSEFNNGLKKLIEKWEIDPNLLPPFIK